MSSVLCPWCGWPFALEATEHREGCPATAPVLAAADVAAGQHQAPGAIPNPAPLYIDTSGGAAT